MSYLNSEELFQTAQEYFNEDNFAFAEPLLNQLLLRGGAKAECHYMLATIYYDKGKFSKAIASFKRSIEIDPSFTDASVGLSVILNDLGRYEEGGEVFAQAQSVLDKQNSKNDPYVNEKLAFKHEELAELYLKYKRYDESLEQLYKALQLTTKKSDVRLKIADIFYSMGQPTKVISELKLIIKDDRDYLPAKLRLGDLYYEMKQITLAVAQWEQILRKHAGHPLALKRLEQANQSSMTFNNPIGFEDPQLQTPTGYQEL